LTAPFHLSEPELAQWAAALQGSFVDILGFLRERIHDLPPVEAALLQVLAERPEVAAGVGKAILALPPEARARVLPRAVADGRPGMRAALFEAWVPPRTEVPRRNAALLPEPGWTELLRGALTDPDPVVRRAGAALAFDTGVGAPLAAELLAGLEGGDGPVHDERRWFALLALGAARDPASLARLRAAAAHGSPALAGAAVRALAARPDGRQDFWSALQDPRDDLRANALFALRRVVVGLTADELARLESPGSPDEVRSSARAYRERTGRSDA
jgi:hypothetical protein